MATGQIDPARLDGDALKQWYLRSPADIQDERRQAEDRTYNAFFSQPDEPQPDEALAPPPPATTSKDDPSGNDDLVWRQVGPNRFRSERAAFDPTLASAADSGSYQLAATTFPRWGRWPIWGCANCHDPQAGALRPDSLPSRPPMFSPRSGGATGYGGSEPDRRDKKECDQQYESDSQTCGRLKSPKDVAICRGTASDRFAHCLRPDGTIGFPHLETRGGRRP
jgi:hypothetical protein